MIDGVDTMSIPLLERTRRLNSILQNSDAHSLSFADICALLSEVLQSNVYLVDDKGALLGYKLMENFKCSVIEEEILKQKRFPSDYSRKLLQSPTTKANITQQYNSCVFDSSIACLFPGKLTTIVPINGGGQRLGTLIFARFGNKFEDEDLILAEYSATVVGMEIMRKRTELIEEEARRRAVVELAMNALSYSELEAVESIVDELNGNEGLLIASKIADKVGITRSVIVNALRKLESAGIIESRSLGMKGTYIRILNEELPDELKKRKSQELT
ncbi:MAG: transcriptional pleiotropic repressor [Clostridiales bacterium]|nr:transcriptional pleiotropic repressor [Clostridiales bacterium]MDK2991939.1 transcriptional pleiotropic repressor [Clostridiales bacterium]